MAVEHRFVSERELRDRIEKYERALRELDAWETHWGSRKDCEDELEAARYLLGEDLKKK